VAGVGLIHFVHDAYTAFLAPLLPLLIDKMHLSFLQAGSLTLFVRGPSVLNPFLGALSDRRRLGRVFLCLSPGITAVLMCLAGLAPGYGVLTAILLAAGLSVAALHVSAPVQIARMSKDRVGRGMGIFMLGGELARTLGPLAAVWAVSVFGLEGLWKAAAVGVAASVVLWWRLPREGRALSERAGTSLLAMLHRMRSIFTGVLGVIVARALMAGAILAFLPTFLHAEGHPLWISAAALSVYELAGAAGAFLSGSLSDRTGRRKVLLATVVVAPLAMLAMLHTEGVLLFLSLVVLGFSLLAANPVIMAVTIENAGDDPAAANGMYMAIAFAVRASVVLLVGWLSDVLGMRAAFHVCAVVGVLGLPFVFLIPDRKTDPCAGRG